MKMFHSSTGIKCHASPLLWIFLLTGTLFFLSLSYWQLHKGLVKQKEKAHQQSIISHLTLQDAFDQWQYEPSSINDLSLTLKGHLLPDILILHDNRILNGMAGYAVYALFLLETPLKEKKTILINLGWTMVPAYDRQAIPKMQLNTQQVHLNVLLEHIYPDIFTLDNAIPEVLSKTGNQTVLRIQTVQFALLEQSLKQPLLPFVARSRQIMTQPELPLYVAPLTDREITAEKHFGYSIQWLIFWLISLGIFIYTQCSWYDKLRK